MAWQFVRWQWVITLVILRPSNLCFAHAVLFETTKHDRCRLEDYSAWVEQQVYLIDIDDL